MNQKHTRPRSFRYHLQRIYQLTLGVSLAIVVIVVIVTSFTLNLSNLIKTSQVNLEVLAENVGAAVLFNDVDAVQQIIQDPHLAATVDVVAVYDSKDKLFAYTASPMHTVPPLIKNDLLLSIDHFELSDSMLHNGQSIGQVHFVVNLRPLYRTLFWQIIFVFAAAILAVFIGKLLLSRLSATMLRPLTNLVDVMNSVSRHAEYNQQATAGDIVELRTLSTRFNEMLERIHERDAKLASHREKLEDEVKARTSQLQRAKEEAEFANQAKTQFLSSMSHELLTPLNAILSFAQLYEYDSKLTAEQRANAREIYIAGKLLLSLINEILDLARIESGHIDLTICSVPLKEVLAECRSLIVPIAERKGITLDIKLSDCDNLHVKADHTRLKQVLLNLISNAVKYSRENGYIATACSVYNSDTVSIIIKDTGAGIATNKLNKLFLPFSRLSAEPGHVEGTGIGLMVTKDLVELMGGKIEVDSDPGRGSAIRVYFKLASSGKMNHTGNAADRTSTVIERPETISSNARILIAEDNIINQDVLRQQLEMLGLHADFADDGMMAWELLNKCNYDILFTDIQMPLMNGYELADKIRQAEKATGTHLPIIAITANATKQDKNLCLDKGMDFFLSKPVHLEKLRTTLKQWLPVVESDIPASHPQVNRHADDVDTGTVQPVNFATLVGIVGDDLETHRKLFRKFIELTPAIIKKIQEAHEQRAPQTIGQQAHKLKSSARGMGAHELADVCQSLEQASKSNQWKDIDEQVPRLEELFNLVRNHMESYCASIVEDAATD